MRLAFACVLVALVLLGGAVAIGRAFDQQLQDRVIFTKHGQTLDCNRTVGAEGEVFYDHCNEVP